ncbi:E3 ubiquitin-protein ligase RNF187 [Microtus oregoni]|uniref:E3 ubiquitin-protein ligase RNF187 n=1 Tax=Microtus oregoni TaxID=111838 RepID=UPI001BB2106F|nr:E3 ubiquitin-protein ligase RNF187 [Microtus oregoni]
MRFQLASFGQRPSHRYPDSNDISGAVGAGALKSPLVKGAVFSYVRSLRKAGLPSESRVYPTFCVFVHQTSCSSRVGSGEIFFDDLAGGARSCQDLAGRTRSCQDLDVRAHGSPNPAPRARSRRWRSPGPSRRLRLVHLALRPIPGLFAPSPPASRLAPPPAALALPAGPAEAVCALCQRAPREPVRADCGHRFCRACVVRFWAEEDGPFPCPECADDCWQRAVEPSRPPLSRRLLALEEAAAAPARDGPASEAALQLLCRADGDPLCSACRMAAGPEPPEWEPRWRKALRGKENKGSVEIMRKDLNDARDLHGQAESAAAVWKGHVMDRRKKALTDYRKLRAFFVEEEEHFLQEAEKDEGTSEDDELADPADRFRSLLQAVSELEKKHRNLGLSMLLQ